LYDEAVKQNAQSFQCLLSMAANNIKLEKYQDVLSDCKSALKLNPSDSLAFFRIGLAQFFLDDYKSAFDSFNKSKEISRASKCDIWIRKCKAEIQRNGGDVARPPTTVDNAKTTVVNASSVSSASSSTSPVSAVASSSPNDSSTVIPTQSPTIATPSVRKPIVDNWYQTKSKVTITIFAKNLQRKDVSCDNTSDSLSIGFQNGDEMFSKKWSLFAPVIQEQTEVSVNPFKIEIEFTKVKAAEWPSLEQASEEPVKRRENISEISGKVDPKKYPTSSTNKKDWEEMDVAVKKEEEAEKPEGDAALHKLFQNIYSGADEDTRRAMIKSYQTSGGTVLSTNWKEVAKSDYEKDITAPAGQEVRKWGK